MRKIWRAIAQHRALAVLFAVYWVLAFGVCAGQLLDFQLLFRISLAYHPHPVLQGFILEIAYTIVFLGGLGGWVCAWSASTPAPHYEDHF
jgi:Na+/alanine symporter